MLILVAVTVNVAMNGGLFGKASEASKQTQIESDREALLSCVVGAVGIDGKVDFSKFKSLAEKEGFKVDGVGFPCTVTSKKQNTFTVTANGEIIPPDGDEYLALLQKYFVGKSAGSFIIDEDSDISFKDGTGDAQGVKGSDLSLVYSDDGDSSDSSSGVIYVYIKYAKNNKYYKVTMTWAGDTSGSSGSSENGSTTYDSSSESEDTYDTSDDSSSSYDDDSSLDGLIVISVEPYNGDFNFSSSSSSSSYSGSYSDDSSSSSGNEAIQIGDFVYRIEDNTATLIGLTSQGAYSSEPLTPLDEIPYQGEKYTVTTIKSHAFDGRSNLVLTNLPSGLTSIENTAFCNCTSLALTSLPSGITSIESGAFSGCTSLALESLPDSLISIEEKAFSGCTSLALTSLPDSLTSIGFDAFSGCTGITQLDISEHPNKEILMNSETYPWGLDKDQLKTN